VSGQLCVLATSVPEKDPQYPLDSMLDGPQGQSGRFGGVHCTASPRSQVYFIMPQNEITARLFYFVSIELL
jgi:hypothetical protein